MALGHGGGSFSTVDEAGTQLAIVTFNAELRDRGWPAPGRHFSILARSKENLDKVRMLISVILKLAADGANALTIPATSEAVKETLLLAFDQVFDSANLAEPRGSLHSSRTFALMQDIESRIRADISGPIYSEALANAVGISVRRCTT